MSATSFVAAGGSIAFASNPRRPARTQGVQQGQKKSGGGEPVASAVYATDLTWPLHWPRMSSADYAALQTFFRTTVRGMADTFSWTDTSGTVRTVRFGRPSIEAAEIAYDRYAVDLILLEA